MSAVRSNIAATRRVHAPDYVARARAATLPGKPIDELARELGLDPATIVKLASQRKSARARARRCCAAIAGRGRRAVTRYPDGNGFALKAALAGALDVAPEQLVLGNGSNDVLELVTHGVPAAGRRGGVRAACVRRLSARDAGARRAPASRCRRATTATTCRRCARRSRRRRASCSSPIRTIRPARGSRRTTLEAFIASVPRDVVVVLDEAYNEYLEPARRAPSVAWIARYPQSRRVADVLQGLRPRGAARRLRRHGRQRRRHAEPRAPAVQRQRARAGRGASRRSPTPTTSRRAARSTRGHAQLEAGLHALGVRYVPSHGNFVLVEGRRCARAINRRCCSRA